jgi:hypothetical protein
MGLSRRQFIAAAMAEIGMADYVFDLQAEDLQVAARRLNSMLMDWNGRGVRLGYALVSDWATVDLDADTLVPDVAEEAIITNLAIRIAPGYGKTVSPDTKAAAKNGYNTLLGRAAVPPTMQFPSSLPAGAGNKPWRYDDPFLPRPRDDLAAGPDATLEFGA